MILSAIAAKLKQRAKADFKDRHSEAALIFQAVSWYLRYPLSYRGRYRTARNRGFVKMRLRVAIVDPRQPAPSPYLNKTNMLSNDGSIIQSLIHHEVADFTKNLASIECINTEIHLL